MRILYLSLHAPFVASEVASGNQVRVEGLSTALRTAGCDVRLLCLQAPGHEALKPGYFSTATDLAQEIDHYGPTAILVGYWSLLGYLPAASGVPVILDAIAPRLLEAQFQAPGVMQQEARQLLGVLPKADFLLVGNQRQADHWSSLLLLAGFDCRMRVPIGIVPIAVSGEPAARDPGSNEDGSGRPITLVSAGVDWPWRQSAGYFKVLHDCCAQNPGVRFQHVGGRYPGAREDSHLLSHAAMQSLFRQCDAGLELSERNTEREFSHSFRVAEYLQCGLPVIANRWLPVAPLIDRHNAGWLVDTPDELPALLQSLRDNPGTLREKAHGARKLAQGELNYRHCIQPLLEYLREPWRSTVSPGLLQGVATDGSAAACAPRQPRWSRTRNLFVQAYQSLFCRRRPPLCKATLVMTRSDLFPTDHGAAVKILRTAEALSRLGRDVFLCTDNRREYHRFEDGRMTTLRYPLWLRLLALPRRLALLRLLLNGYPMSNAFLYYPLKDFSYVLRGLYLATRHNAGSYLAEFPAYVQPLRYVRRILGGNVVLVQHNVEYERLREQIPTLSEQGYQELKHVELQMCAAADSVIVVSEPDRQRLLQDGVDAHKLTLIPHGVDVTAFGSVPVIDVRTRFHIARDSLLLVYHGTYSYKPNLQAMQYMASELLPRLEALGLQVDVLAIGSKPPSTPLHPRLHFVGSVDNLASVLPAADLAVVCLLEGGGTRMKILDYFAAGVPVISTTKGIEGIPVTDGREALIRDGVDQLCAAVQDLANDRAKAKALATQARQFVAGLGWDSMAARYDPLLGIVGDRPEA